jgi:hypothetical protein
MKTLNEQVKELDNEEQEKALALLTFLEIEKEEDENLDYYLSQASSTDSLKEVFEVDGEEYLILTDDEADEKEDEYLDNYIDDCLDIPESIQFYFDRDAWKSDARIDGRGHSLATYDGNENEQEINDTTYYIYRTN